MKTKDIHELSEIEVEKKLRDTRDEHVKMRMSKQTGQVEETHKLKNLRFALIILVMLIRGETLRLGVLVRENSY